MPNINSAATVNLPVLPTANVLVLMATFNGGRWLGEQLRSIQAQHDVTVAIAICDDGSSDDTLAVAEQARHEGLDVRLVSSMLPGGSASRNFFRLMMAADCGGFDFVALADQDDIWSPDKLARAVQTLRRGDAVGYSGAVEAFWPGGRRRVLAQSSQLRRGDFIFEGAGQGCTFVLRHSWFQELVSLLCVHAPLIESVHYHDWTLYALSRMKEGTWVFDARPSIRYRQHGENDTGARGNLAGIQRRLALIRSGWYGQQIGAMAALCAAVSPEQSGPVAEFIALQIRAQTGGLWARLNLAAWIFANGRRRFADRVIVCCAAVAGYI